MNRKAIVSTILALSLCAGMSVTASAIYDPMKAMEDISRKAVTTAISEGKIPSDATIFDCAYSKDANGVTCVVQYRDKNGMWVDVTAAAVATQETPQPPQSPQLPIITELSAETLDEYADEVFRLTNEAREQAGLSLLERSDELDEAAAVRADECASLNSLRVNGIAHLRPDGSKFSTILSDMGIDRSNGAGENSAYGHSSPETVIKAWLDSSGHKANMMNEVWSGIGIEVRKAEDGTLYWVQLFV
jgi:uncharacterized protein YkwD